MKGLKKFLSLILVVSVVFSAAPNAFAAWGEIDVLVVGTPAAKAKFLRIYSGKEVNPKIFESPTDGARDGRTMDERDKVNSKIRLHFVVGDRENSPVANPAGVEATKVPAPTMKPEGGPSV